MAKTLEFYEKRNRIYVEYAGNHYPLTRFFTLPEAAEITARMYKHIITDHSTGLEREVSDLSNKAEVLAVFIKKHFLKKDNTFDVVYLEGGNRMRFNLED